MTVTKERFLQGMTYEDWKAHMTRNRERVEQNERSVELSPDDLEPFLALDRPLQVLVLAEDWCADVVANLPILGRIAKETGKLDLRVFDRDKNPDLMDQYLKDGTFRSIPACIFFDRSFREIGRFIERPDAVTALRAKKRREIYETHPEFGEMDGPIDVLPEDVRVRLQQAMAAMREETKPFAERQVIHELRAIVARARVAT